MNETPVTSLVNPFVGLRSFEEDEDYLFFGRSAQIDELLKKFNESHFLAVIGASGSGKSSLVRSGLLPAIYSGFMKVGSNWRMAIMQPGENPIGYLTATLAADETLYSNTENTEIPREQIIEASLRRSENGLVQVYKDAHLSPHENLLIVVDQFEELFRFSKYEKDNKFNKSDAMHFVQILLTAALQEEYPVYVLITMRSDFLGDCAEFRGLPEAINSGQYLVPRMTREQIREAITRPIAVSNATITQRLVTRLLNDINNDTDQLPILQHAMMRTWDAWHKRDAHTSPIDFCDYEKIGTMKTALSQHADEAYEELKTENEQHVCGLMFKALTDKTADLKGVRRPRSIIDLCLLTGAEQNEIFKQVEIFRKSGRTFLMPGPHIPLTGNTVVDISHESLMRVWSRLVKWTEEEARSGDLYKRLVNSAELKEQGQRGLLKDPELAIALNWRKNNKPSPKWAENYKGDFFQAIAYLDESQLEDVAEKKALAKLSEDKINADKKAARQKLMNVIFALITLLLIGALVYKKEITEAKRLAVTRQNTIDSLSRVLKTPKPGNVIKTKTVTNDSLFFERNRADSFFNIILRDRVKTDTNNIIDKKIKDTVQHLRIIIDSLSYERKKQSFKRASSEYEQLIEDGPETKDEILKDSFDYKLIAYAVHLDTLQSLIKLTGDKKLQNAYGKLKDKLYYDNILYEKTYTSFETVDDKNARQSIFDKVKYDTAFDGTDTTAAYKIVQKQLGNRLLSSFQNKDGQRLICATSDNWIYVFTTGNNPQQENRIPMGAKVTAVYYDNEKQVIYFGLQTGDIGYIRYNRDNKNQPVFQNQLSSPITAIQSFKHVTPDGGNSFLLAAAKNSTVVVYKTDDTSLIPNKMLPGNILPEKKLGEVSNAKFDDRLQMVLIKVDPPGHKKEIVYAWNPFTDEILKKYRHFKNDPDFEEKYLEPTNFYNK